MSKVIEDAAKDFAEINDDKAANSAHSYSKYDIADAYQQGDDFGYCLAEKRIKKEYEEKLRWIPIEEKLPEKQGHYLVKAPKSFPKNCIVVVAEFYEDNNTFYSESSDCPIEDATHWRSF